MDTSSFMDMVFHDTEWINAPVNNGIREKTVELDQQEGFAGRLSATFLEHIRICHRTIMQPHVHHHFQTETKNPTIEMHFSLKGTSRASTPILQQPVQIKGGQQNLIAIPSYQAESVCFEKGSEPVQDLEIQLTPDFFREALTDKCQLQRQMTEQLEKGTLLMADTNHAPITPQMQATIIDILQCNRSGYLKKVHLESKVLELLMLQVEGFEQKRRVSNEINSADRDKLYAVKELIDDQPEADYSLSGLSHYGELNTFKLKSGFKALFGSTVFDYINEVRMQKAKRWLLEGEKNVTEAAYSLGYDYPNNFSVAFKRTFGMNPSELKK